jgi:hypothetical protein
LPAGLFKRAAGPILAVVSEENMRTYVRCIRFAPWDLPNAGLEVERWREKFVPGQWRDIGDHVLYRRERAAELNLRYGVLLDALAESRCPGGERLHGLAFELIRQGEEARHWIAAGGLKADSNERRRVEDSNFVKLAGQVPNLALRLAANLEREQSAFAVAQALRVSAIRIESLEADLEPGAAMAKLLRNYSDIISRLHTAHRGPFLHRTVIGPLVFTKPVDGPALHRGAAQFNTITAILFGAVSAARGFTGRKGWDSQQGALMPLDGQPLYEVAAALVTAVTGEIIDAEQARTRLRKWIKRNPSAGWFGWPNRDT